MQKALRIFGVIIILGILGAGIFSAGVFVGKVLLPEDSPELITTASPNVPEPGSEAGDDIIELPEDHPPLSDPEESSSSSEDLESLFNPFWETWDIIHDQYVDQPVDDYELMQGAIRGMLESLGDQHTSYMDPDQFMQANIPLDGEYEGIGAWVDSNREFLTIVSPMPNSPAEDAGLKPGDEIIAVDGEDMTGIDGNLVIRRVLGPAGSKVILTIQRDGVEDQFDVEITRAKITIPSVEYRMLDDDIAYIHLLTFGAETRDELRDAIKEILKDDPQGLIFDLRNNGGGYLSSAVEVASEFIGDGIILYEDYGSGERETFEALRGGLAVDIPLVVLINEGSASASEIVAGAIQDYERAPLVGATSFGKGSVQNWVPLSNEQGAIRVTIARWYTPNDRLIHEVGLEPDYPIGVVTQSEVDAGLDLESLELDPDRIFILTAEDIEDGVDPQLNKAIEVLLSQ